MLAPPWRGFVPRCAALGGGGEHAAAAEDGGGGGHGGGAGGEEAVGDAAEGSGAEVAGAAEVDAVEGAGGAEGGEDPGDVGAEGGAVDDGGVVPEAAAADPDAGVVAVAEVAAAAAADGGEGDAAAVVPGATAEGGAVDVVEGSVEAEGGVDGAEVGAGPADGGGGAGDGDLGAVVGGELLLLEELLAGLEFEGALDDAEAEFGGLALLGGGLFAGFGDALLFDEFSGGGFFLEFFGAFGIVAEFLFPGIGEVGEEDFGGAFGMEEGDAVGVDLADAALAIGAAGEGGEFVDLVGRGSLSKTAGSEEQGQDQYCVFHGGAELNFHTL
jgi:hypothetical protein